MPTVGDRAIHHDLALRQIPRLDRQTNDTHTSESKETQTVFSTPHVSAHVDAAPSTTMQARASTGTRRVTSTSSAFRITKQFSISEELPEENYPDGQMSLLPSPKTLPTLDPPYSPMLLPGSSTVQKPHLPRPASRLSLPRSSLQIPHLPSPAQLSLAQMCSQPPVSVNSILMPIITGGKTTSLVVTETVARLPQTTARLSETNLGSQSFLLRS